MLREVVGVLASHGLGVRALVTSPLRGADGNIEFFSNAAHNLYSDVTPVHVGGDGVIRISVTHVVPAYERRKDTEWVKQVTFQSPKLTMFWGRPIFIQRFNRSPLQNALVELRALSNIGQGYIAGDANCEHDMTMAQTGIPYSPTANNVKLLTLVGGTLFVLKLLSDD